MLVGLKRSGEVSWEGRSNKTTPSICKQYLWASSTWCSPDYQPLHPCQYSQQPHCLNETRCSSRLEGTRLWKDVSSSHWKWSEHCLIGLRAQKCLLFTSQWKSHQATIWVLPNFSFMEGSRRCTRWMASHNTQFLLCLSLLANVASKASIREIANIKNQKC